MVILLSTRGTAGSDIWFMCLADKPMVRGYHLRDYDWTPLSQNPVQTRATIPFAPARLQAEICAGRPISAPAVAMPRNDGSCRALTVAPACRSDTDRARRAGAKSFVDDLVLSRGVVLSRAVLLCDLLRLSLLTRRFVRFRRAFFFFYKLFFPF